MSVESDGLSAGGSGEDRSDDGLAAWRAVAGDAAERDPGAERLARVAADVSVAEIAALRKDFPAAWVSVAIEWGRARAKAAVKWPGRRVVCDVPGIEMASGAAIARHKAGRILGAGVPIVDLCCGVGGDLMGVVEVARERGEDAGARCQGVELDPVRAWMASVNAGVPVRTGDAEGVPLAGRVVHLDPSRRDRGGRRTVRYEDLVPGPVFVERVARESAGAAVKLMPGIDAAALPAGEVEYISEGGTLKQAVLWTGSLAAGGGTRATMVTGGAVETLALEPGVPPHRDSDRPPRAEIGGPGTWVYAADASVERAGLLGVLCARLGLGMPHARAGLLVSGARVESAWLRGFEVIEACVWSRKRVRGIVRAAGGGTVDVKTRGGVVDADAEARALRGDGGRALTVFVVRLGDAGIRAVVCVRA